MKFHASGLWRKALPLLVIYDVALARRLAYYGRQINEGTQSDILAGGAGTQLWPSTVPISI
jgi:hypothetical protein